jgi:hypothetical protein
MSLITILEDDLKAGWNWLKTEAAALYAWGEPIVAAALKTFEQVVVQDLWGAIASFIQKATTFRTLADAQQAFLMTIELVSRNVFNAAISLGSNLLQTLLGAVQAHVSQPATAS